ncbi:MAG: hypothetical protein COB78_05355 [Hyphomicrobiales bacterium]|nr:MAG: hypothetical protein COB78_05355 [Hyphomicrobiales bacterium]
MHEETLDHMLLAELSAAPPRFFGETGAAVVIETHWLGGRRMYGRWEIADIALLILLRNNGGLVSRKVTLLQTKRLYTREIPTSELDDADFIIGIARLGDRTGKLSALTQPRKFSFTENCVFGAMSAGSPQVSRIDQYQLENEIPVHYAFYCPVEVPFECEYPSAPQDSEMPKNNLGCRVQSSKAVHRALGKVVAGKPPSLAELSNHATKSSEQNFNQYGWKLEDFVADEVLACRQGKLFDGSDDANLERLFYERSAPISSAISITIDLSDFD